MRDYHSASSDSAGRRCKRAWYYTYVVGMREPNTLWADVSTYVYDTSARLWRDPADPANTVQSRQRSTALGTAVHSTIESWYHGADPDWHDLPGRVALSGLHLLPHPDKCHDGGTEVQLGQAAGHLELDGIRWRGMRDLIASAPGEFLRLGIDAPDGWALIDHKSSADVQRYSLSAAELHTDYAANLYALATCADVGAPSIPARWVYYETKDVRRSLAVDTTIHADAAYEAVRAASTRARELDSIRDAQDAEPNTAACGDFGGCQYHVSVGGPCTARRSVGKSIQAHTQPKKVVVLPMAMSEEMAAKFAKFKAKDAEPAPVEEAPAAPKAVGRPRKAKEVVEPAVLPTAPDAASWHQSWEVPGAFGPLMLTGDARDVLAAARILRA